MNILRLARLEITLELRRKMAFLVSLVMPLLLFVITQTLPFGNSPTTLFIGWVSLFMTFRTIMGSVGLLGLWQENGILRRYQAAAIQPLSILIALALKHTFSFLLITTIIWLFGFSFLGIEAPRDPWSVLLMALLSLTALTAFSALMAALFSKMEQHTLMMLMNVFCAVQMFLTGFMRSEETLVQIFPTWLLTIAKTLPLYHIMRLMRATWFGTPITELYPYIIALVLITLICFILAAIKFRWSADE